MSSGISVRLNILFFSCGSAVGERLFLTGGAGILSSTISSGGGLGLGGGPLKPNNAFSTFSSVLFKSP